MAPPMGSRGSRVRRIRSPTPTLSSQCKLLIVSSDEYPTLEAHDFIVTRCATAQEPIPILQESAIDFVLVDADVDGGFKLVRRITKHTNVRVAMVSSSRNEEVMKKGFEKGACDFFVKPVNADDLRNRMLRSRPAVEVDDPTSHAPPSKRPRVIWDPELHSKFVEAVNLLGITKAVPKKILEIMNVPDLTRENVASHLQKYRQHCKKREESLQKQAIGATFDPRPPSPILPPIRPVSLMGRPENRVFECGVGANQMPRAYFEGRNLHQEHEIQAFGGHEHSFGDMGYTSLVSSVDGNSQMISDDSVDFYGQHAGTYGVDVYQPPSFQHPKNEPVIMGDLGEPSEQGCVVNSPLFNAPLWEDYRQGGRENFMSPQMQHNHLDDYSWFRPHCSTAADFKIERQVEDPCLQVNQIPKSDQLMDPTNQENGELQDFDYINVALGFDGSV